MSIRDEIAALGEWVYWQTAADIAGMMGYDDVRESDIKDLERILKDMGLKSKWTNRREGRVKIWFNPLKPRIKPGQSSSAGSRVRKIKLTPVPEHKRRSRPHSHTQAPGESGSVDKKQ